jgi:glycosyltransferase involved in cell wall biosynthesis
MAVSTSVSTPHGAPLRVMVLGLRGVYDVGGGIESHARMLYPLLARLGCEVEIVQRSPYFPRSRRRGAWHGVRLSYLWSPKGRGLETGVHTLLGVLYAAVVRPDILHLHAVGPGMLAPLARALGLKIVITHHGADYEREKWGGLARVLLRTGERLGVRFANRPIVVAPNLKADVETRYGVGATLIPNGAPTVQRAATRAALARFGLTPGRYVLNVARFQPEKRQNDLVDAFQAAALDGWKLALVGGLEAGDPYCDALVRRAAADPRIVLTDYQTGVALRELYSHAGLFVLPSSLEGHPIVLLEAAAYGLPLLASAIPANLAVPLPRGRFFAVGDVAALAAQLTAAALDGERDGSRAEWQGIRSQIRELYSWRRAARLTRSVYDAANGGSALWRER